MGDVNFYLKKAEAKTGKSLIYLQFRYKGQKLVFAFGETIDPGNWNYNKQRVKGNTATTGDGKHYLNDLLDNLEKECKSAYNKEIKNGIPLPRTLKKYLQDFLNQNTDKAKQEENKPTLYGLLDRFIDGEIRKKGGKQKSEKTCENYNAVKLHLQDFEKNKRYRIDFNTITLDFFHSYVTFLERGYSTVRANKSKIVKLKPNSVAKDIRVIKAIMNKAVSLGYTNNVDFRHDDFSYSEEDIDAIYVKENEIERLFKFDFNNERLNNVKDLFVFGCFVGLRFSDYSNVKPENLVENEGEQFIHMKTQKTGEWVYIPCHPIVLAMFEKYMQNPNKLPKTISVQRFNVYIKEACQIAGFTETGRLITEPEKPLFQCVSSHTCRRSFATNLFLQGFPAKEIMKITGHKTEESFNKYIRITKLDTAKRLSQHMKDRWNKKLLKLVA
jgi:integrase